MKTTQDAFHSMRGHVRAGTEVVMRDGSTLILRSTMAGWQLVNQDDRPFGQPTKSAHVIECLIYNHPKEEL